MTSAERGAVFDRLVALGHDVIHVPLIAIGPPADDGAALRGALGRLGEFRWLVVTSTNGARAVGAAALQHGRLRLAAVGARTAQVLADVAGRPVDLVPEVERAEGLLAAWPADERGPALLALADRAAPTLADGLRSRGVTVEVVDAYRTTLRTPASDEIEALAASDAVLLASGSAAESLAALPIAGGERRIVVIGPSTAAAAERLGLAVDAIAASPHTDDVVAALAAG
ncbi:uroporphyrinogen-III synthase [Desertimonas flava]|uniref:uroporphyrinogen-III synthase n=1 Tax=Desertimonas flava TaxID=2064846 RepID=UPI0013C42466|nr:uroporphyrinogen-III synthase [Desertimonas flava]